MRLGRAPKSLTGNDRVACRLAAALLAVAFAALYAASSRGVFLYGDDILMFQVTEAIAERGEVGVTSPARRGDVARSIRGADGGRYAKYGIGQSLVAVPFFLASRPLFDRWGLTETIDDFGNLRTGSAIFGTGLTNAATGGATVAVTFLLAAEIGLPIVAAFATALALGLGTLLPHYASTFLSEPLSALCLAVAFLGVVKAGKEARTRESPVRLRGWLALSGVASGLAVATKIAQLVVVAPLAVWVLVVALREARRRAVAGDLLCWGLPFLGWIAAVGAYNRSRFGSFLETGYRGEASNFSTPLLEGLGGLLVSPAKGILWYCPLLLLSLFGARAFFRRQPALALTVAASSLLHLVLMAKYYYWYAGDVWGTRFLIPLLPLWLLPAGESLARWRIAGPAAKAAIAILVSASLAIAAASVLVPFDGYPERQQVGPGHRLENAWSLERSPLVHHLNRLPRATAISLGKLYGREPFAAPRAKPEWATTPDFAFSRYGSHALVEWTRGMLGVWAIALAAAALGARRAQKALLSRPPQ